MKTDRLMQDAFEVVEVDGSDAPYRSPIVHRLIASGGGQPVASVATKRKNAGCFYYDETGRHEIFHIVRRRLRRSRRDVTAPGEGRLWTIHRCRLRWSPTWRVLAPGGRTVAEAREPGMETGLRRFGALIGKLIAGLFMASWETTAASELKIRVAGREVGGDLLPEDPAAGRRRRGRSTPRRGPCVRRLERPPPLPGLSVLTGRRPLALRARACRRP